MYYKEVNKLSKQVTKLSKEEFEKLHNQLVDLSLKYTDNMAVEGVKNISWTLTNDFVVTFRDLKRKSRTQSRQNNQKGMIKDE